MRQNIAAIFKLLDRILTVRITISYTGKCVGIKEHSQAIMTNGNNASSLCVF